MQKSLRFKSLTVVFMSLAITGLPHFANAQTHYGVYQWLFGDDDQPEISEFADNVDRLNKSSSSQTCDECFVNPTRLAPKKCLRPQPRPYIGHPLTASFKELIGQPEDDQPWPCEKFIKANGTYGKLGEIVSKSLDSLDQFPLLMSDATADLSSMKQACPNFRWLNRKERANFWVWTIAAIAWDETKCGAVLNNEENVNAFGILQLHRSDNDRDNRGGFCADYSDEEMAQEGYQMTCGLTIMNNMFEGIHCKKDEQYKRGLFPCAYWEQLQGTALKEGSRVLSRIKEFPLCKKDATPKRPKARPQLN